MFQLLRQPYPLNESRRHDFLFAVGAGLFVALFLLLFQPFGLSQWQPSGIKTAVIAGYGLVTFGVMLLWEFGLKRGLLAGRYTEENHTVGRQILYVALLLLLIAVGNYLYTLIVFDKEGPGAVEGFGKAVLYTLMIGIFPTVASVLLNYVYQLRKYSHPPQVVPQVPAPPSAEVLKLVAENGKDSLTIRAELLYYIESADNYCLVVYQGEKEKKRDLVRSSLSRLEEQISSPWIVRCHRSFIVNLSKVEKITGNAQGYKLYLTADTIVIPVARRYNSLIIERLKRK